MIKIIWTLGAEVDGEIVKIGDNIMLEPENEGEGTQFYFRQIQLLGKPSPN